MLIFKDFIPKVNSFLVLSMISVKWCEGRLDL